MSGLTVRRAFRSRSTPRGNGTEPSTVERIPRVARLMALASRFDEMIREGVVADQAELARLGQVTRARLTQIMDLTNLAPQIQEELLQTLILQGRDLTERQLRPISAIADWRRQIQEWQRIQKKGVRLR